MVRREMFWLWAPLLVIVEVTAHYTPQWAAHIEGGPEVARRIVEGHGFTLLAEIFPDTYHLVHTRVAKRSASPNRYHHDRLTSEKQVVWAKQLKVKRRVKRDLLTRKELGLPEDHVILNDPKWSQMWYLNRGAGLDMSVEGAWREGVTGKGIVVTILDDGLEKDHPDLKENYDPMASYDVNGHDDNPMPRYDLIDSNRHGTRCAGEVAAVANNSLCSLGIAYHASVGGVRMLDGDVTDAVEARSLSLNPQHIDIYSASWGPDDDGKTVDGPGELATRAFINGVNKGRAGKGSIFVWASGNGGRDHDNCNCDGYTNSIWTLSISSATENGLVPWYSEACSSTLATTYSSGSTGEKQIVTTDLHHQCTISHTGTSASAPLAAGICALALEANTELTWRDMQHIVVATAKPANLKATDWVTNGVGRNVSHSFGYGLMDAAAMVRLARSWMTVPTQQKCEVSAPHIDKAIPAKSHVTLQLIVKECPGVRYLEHVQAKITLMTQRRGDIEIHLTSPAGTKTMLLAKRPHDVSRTGFRNWPFMSVHTWGESPIGKWSLEIHNEARFLGRATLQDWALILFGTDNAPQSFNQAYVPPSPPPTTSTPSKPSSTAPPTPGVPGVTPAFKKGKGSRKNKGTNPTTKSGKGKGKKIFDLMSTPFPALPLPGRKTPRPSVIQARRPTMVPATHPVGLTILLAPPQPGHTSDASHSFPAIFQQYHKVQQLFPYSKINESPLRPSKKGLVQSEPQRETAQLSEWNLIFYGTETAPGASPDSVDTKPISTNDASGRGDHFGHDNALDPPSFGGKWREVTQRTGMTSENVELPSSRDDLSSGCAKPSDACLECFQGWVLLNGRCIKPEDAVALPSLGCSPGEYKSEGVCLKCHYTCRKCSGPGDYECTQCYPDAVVYATTGENFCFPKSLLTSVNYTVWLHRVYYGLLLNVVFLMGAGVVIYVRERGCRLKKTRTITPKVLESMRYKLTADNSDSDN